MPETFAAFGRRRLSELRSSDEWDEISEMKVSDFLKMIEDEYYDRAEDPVPESSPNVVRH